MRRTTAQPLWTHPIVISNSEWQCRWRQIARPQILCGDVCCGSMQGSKLGEPSPQVFAVRCACLAANRQNALRGGYVQVIRRDGRR